MKKNKIIALLKAKYGKITSYCDSRGITKQYFYHLLSLTNEERSINATWAAIVEDICDAVKDMQKELSVYNNLEEKNESDKQPGTSQVGHEPDRQDTGGV